MGFFLSSVCYGCVCVCLFVQAKSVAVRSRRSHKHCGTWALDNSTKTFAALNNSSKNNDAYKRHL